MVKLALFTSLLFTSAACTFNKLKSSPIMNKNRMPTIYIPHGGGPCFFMDWDPPNNWDSMKSYLEHLPTYLPRKPKAILLISAHWNDPDIFTVGSGPQPKLIYDYYGFPSHTYKLKYDAPGNPELASKVKELISSKGIGVKEDSSRGYDHGVFIPLKVSFPDADIPIVTLSLRKDLDPQAHLAVGKALESLRDEDVLIIGSGMSFHNMGGYDNPKFFQPSKQFDDFLKAAAERDEKDRYAMLVNWAKAPGGRESHPFEDHLLPLMVVAGAAGKDKGVPVFSDKVSGVMISGFQFG